MYRGRERERRLIDASFEVNANQLNCGRRPRVPASNYKCLENRNQYYLASGMVTAVRKNVLCCILDNFRSILDHL